MKTNTKLYYVGLNKKTNSVIISTSKLEIASYIGISVITINRHMIKTSVYDTEKYTVWKNVPIIKIKRGFAL